MSNVIVVFMQEVAILDGEARLLRAGRRDYRWQDGAILVGRTDGGGSADAHSSSVFVFFFFFQFIWSRDLT